MERPSEASGKHLVTPLFPSKELPKKTSHRLNLSLVPGGPGDLQGSLFPLPHRLALDRQSAFQGLLNSRFAK